MKLLYLLYLICSISLSHAYYGPPDQTFAMDLGIQPIVFQTEGAIYTMEGSLPFINTQIGNVTTMSIDADKNLHTQTSILHPAGFECQYCAAFVLNDSFVLILTGFSPLPPLHNISFNLNMGVIYFNPQQNNFTRPDNYKALPGSPLQRFYQNNVITPDNNSIYIFGGVGVYQNNSLDMPIMRLDLTTWTFSQFSNFTYLGGTATMLPSGIVVLAFGTKGFNAQTYGTYYDTGSVYLFDTKTNTLSTQPVGGIPPPPRGEATGVLGPDNECIYYFGGNDFEVSMLNSNGTPDHDYTFIKTFSDLIILNTSSWTWYTPIINGMPSTSRFGAFSVLYNANTIIIGGGGTGNNFLRDISVLRNLPSSGQTIASANLEWFTNSYLDDYYDLSGQGLSTGGVIGVTIGVLIFVAIVVFLLWRFIPHFKEFMIYLQHEVIWKPRSGEPFWAESSRLITRFVLFVAFVAFLVYAIYRTIESPNLEQLQYESVNTMQIPDIRICTQTFDKLPASPFTIQCQLTNGTDCSNYFYDLSSSTVTPIFNGGSGATSCQLLIPPVGLSFEQNPGTYTNQFANSMMIKLFPNDSTQAISVYVTFYSPGYDPNRILYNLFPENEKTIPDYQTWFSNENVLHLTPNTFGTNPYTFTTATYSLTNSVKLSNSKWNYVGFANKYDTTLELEQHVGPLVQVPEFARIANQPALLLSVMPNEFVITTSTETKATTIISGFAQAGGVFGLFIAIQTLLFGFRPDSPWGLVHRWSFGAFRRELANRLTSQFNKLNTPVPIVNPVHDRFSLKSVKPNTFIFETSPFNPNGRNEDTEAIRIQRMEERLQLMELVFKSYYIDDEVFRHLDKAIKNKKNEENKERDSNSSQTNEEIPMSQTHQLLSRDSFIDAPIKSDDNV